MPKFTSADIENSRPLDVWRWSDHPDANAFIDKLFPKYFDRFRDRKKAKKYESFDDFSERNDPFGEHDFGAIEYEGNTVSWKIDYCDPDLMNHSPDPSDPHITRRVLTIMLGEEY